MRFKSSHKLSFVIFLGLTSAALRAEPLWLRYPAISPDGKQIAFTYRGDIYKVSAAGGEAKQITVHEGYEYMPVWSPDGKHIAFASDRNGNFDLYTVPSEGGQWQRLTTWSGSESPYSFTPDGKRVVYSAKIQAPAMSAAFPSGVMSELYSVSTDGKGRPEQFLATPAENVSFTSDGNLMVYQDRKGQEDRFRKHHKSSVTRNIMLYNIKTGKHTELVGDAGEDTNPVFTADGTQIYFLSERSGIYNVYSFDLQQADKIRQHTDFKTHPVRFLSLAQNGTMCFSFDGELYTQEQGGKAKKVKVMINDSDKSNGLLHLNNKNNWGKAVSSDGRQVAVTMRGEIFVTSTEYKYSKRITSTSAQEEWPSFSPDGKTLAYASEREGVWNIYTAKLLRSDEQYFFNATSIKEEPLFERSSTERMIPKFSPDGTELAYIEDRNKLMVYNFATRKTRRITDGSYNPDSSGNIDYEWSPDGQWFALVYVPNKHMPYSDIGLVSSKGGNITNLTGSGYTDANPRWVLDGNAILFRSERYGMRNHASWGSLNDAMLIFMNRKSYDRFMLSDDDFKLLKDSEKDQNKAKDETKSEQEDKDKKDKNTKDQKAGGNSRSKPSDSIVMELENILTRTIRLTPSSSQMGDALLNKDGSKLYYLASFEKGYDLWSINCRTKETKLEVKEAGSAPLYLDKEGKNLFLLGRAMQKITLSDNKKTTINCRAEMTVNLAEERQYMYDHVCRQEEKRFYTVDMHGVDWPLMKKAYARFLPYIDNNYDFAELLSELLGELNVSHTGGRYKPTPEDPDATAQLGLFFNWDYKGDGLLVDEILELGPFDKAASDMRRGCIVEAIDGEKVLADRDYFALLNRKAGQNTLISFRNKETGKVSEEVVKPISISQQNSLLYKRWVKQREKDVDKLSGGQLGYVHIESMGDPSFRTIYSDILGRFNSKKGIVIDTRFNGGGRLHEDIEVLFSGQKYFTQVIRGQEACDMPSRRWNKPSIMITGEANYSNAHGTPWVYRHTGTGKIVGMPVPGTMTSVSWETLQDNTLVFGIPIVGYRLPDGSYLENAQLEPDIKISNKPESLIGGKDEQLERAVKELLKL
ncbi:MAG: DPP IV N-terminal domain-containing protein [Prevotellaceae bacterium]|jgi:Tol biopolymer transport system component/C-terminal processing protease CtpA/Prc|nr:DPP IV N-terminal domain-containing protein [Prevotellaceae bacterium]